MRFSAATRAYFGDEYIRNYKKALLVLRRLITRQEERSYKVCVAGGFALHAYMIKRGMIPEWKPSDIDIFVCCSDDRHEWERETLGRVFDVCERTRGLEVHRTTERENGYIIQDKVVRILDVKFAGLDWTFQFIEGVDWMDTREVVGRFDINVCRVILQVHGENCVASNRVKREIEQRLGLVSPFHFQGPIPTSFEINKLCSTLRRMTKYGERGFMFCDYPLLWNDGVHCVCNDEVEEEVTRTES